MVNFTSDLEIDLFVMLSAEICFSNSEMLMLQTILEFSFTVKIIKDKAIYYPELFVVCSSIRTFFFFVMMLNFARHMQSKPVKYSPPLLLTSEYFPTHYI